MVFHWKKAGGRGARGSMAVNAVGAVATGATAIIVLGAKFVEGAWVVALLVPALIALMSGVRRHYERVARETAPPDFSKDGFHPPLVVAPIENWNSVSQNALRFALTLSQKVQIVHVEYEGVEPLSRDWTRQVELLARASGRPVARLVVLRSPYLYVMQPILDDVLTVERENPGRTVAVVIPQLVAPRWYHYFLHNPRGKLLSALLLLRGASRIAIINLPCYLKG